MMTMMERNVSIANLARAADDNISIEEMARVLAAVSPVEQLVRAGLNGMREIGRLVVSGDPEEAVRSSSRHL